MLGYGVGIGHRLGVALMDGRALSQTLVELAGHVHRADLHAVVATGANLQVHIARPAANPGREVARVPLQGQKIGIGYDLDIGVSAALRQLGGYDAHGAIVGGESLVQLSHLAADDGLPLQQVHLYARIG